MKSNESAVRVDLKIDSDRYDFLFFCGDIISKIGDNKR